MTRRSRAARPAARAAGPEGPGEGPPGGGGADVSTGANAAVAGASVEAGANAPPPLSAALRWPTSALFRWEERAGPLDVWSALPFPPPGGGPGLLARLRTAAASSKLFRARGAGRASAPAISLSAELSVCGERQLFPLNDDEDVEQAIQMMWRPSPGTADVFSLAVREGEGGGTTTTAGHGASPLSHFLGGGGESRPPRPAPALGNALPLEMWACVLNAVASSRSVAFWGEACVLLWRLLPLPAFLTPPLCACHSNGAFA